MMLFATVSQMAFLKFRPSFPFVASLSKNDPVVERIDSLGALACPETQVAMPGLALDLALCALVVAAGLCSAQVGTDLVGADEFLVLVDDGTAE